MFIFHVEAETMTELRRKIVDATSDFAVGTATREQEQEAKTDEAVTEMYPNAAPDLGSVTLEQKPGEPVVAHGEVVQESKAEDTVVNTSDRDSEGLPWDARIHASSRATTKDGSWRIKRGIDDATVTQVKAELRARNPMFQEQAPAPMPLATPVVPQAMPSIIPPAPAVTTPVEMPQAVQTQAPVAVPQAQAKPVQESVPNYDSAIQPVGQKPAHTVDSFRAQFIPTLMQLIDTGKITNEYINSLKEHFEVKEIWDLPKNASNLAKLFDTFVSYGLITKVG